MLSIAQSGWHGSATLIKRTDKAGRSPKMGGSYILGKLSPVDIVLVVDTSARSGKRGKGRNRKLRPLRGRSARSH